jgi:diadenosine tetraphosphate (Ap4A) HIT family hydrolase
MNPDCCFCREDAGHPSEFSELYPDLRSRTIYETPDFRVFPSLGQLNYGHVLLVPRRHVTAFGELDVSVRREALELYESLRLRLSHKFSPPVVFEHGSGGGDDSGGCGVMHAHIHLVPVHRTSVARPRFARAAWRDLEPTQWLERLGEISGSGASYLYWHSPTGRRAATIVRNPPSQYLRQYVASALRLEQWDWRTVGREARLIATYNALKGQRLLPASRYPAEVGRSNPS